MIPNPSDMDIKRRKVMKLYRRNKKYYYVKYVDEDGQEIRVSTGKKRKDEALNILSEMKQNLISKKPEITNLIILKKKYLKHCKLQYSYKYYKNVTYTLNSFSNFIGSKNISNIKKNSLSTFLDDKIKSNKLHQAHQHFRNLRTFFNWAVDNEYISQSPLIRMKPPKLPEKKPIWMTQNELTQVLSNLNSDMLKDIYQVLFYTGMRANELLSLTWSNIDLKQKIIHIKNSKSFSTKTGKERSIPMTQQVYNIIYKQPSRFKGELLFLKNGVKLNVEYVSKQFKKALRQTELDKDIHLHSLRHSFASNLIKEGANIYLVSKLLGHSKVSTTEIYSHVRTEDLRKSIELLNN